MSKFNLYHCTGCGRKLEFSINLKTKSWKCVECGTSQTFEGSLLAVGKEREGAKNTPKGALDKQEGGKHYKDMAIQPIEYVVGNNMSWCAGNIVKYASRYKFKNGPEDIRKVIHYAQLLLKLEYDLDE